MEEMPKSDYNPSTPPSESPSPEKKQAPKNTGMAIVAYIIFFVPLLTEAKNDPFVKYHIKQGFVLFLCGVVLSIIVSIIPYIFLLAWIIDIAVFALLVTGVMNAANGKQKPLPVIGKFAEKIKFLE